MHTEPLIPTFGQLYSHEKGGIYVVEVVTNLDAEDKAKYPPTVVYRSLRNAMVFSRPLDIWLERFHSIDAAIEVQMYKSLLFAEQARRSAAATHSLRKHLRQTSEGEA